MAALRLRDEAKESATASELDYFDKEFDLKVIQHISSSCRVSRKKEFSNLFACRVSFILA